MKKDILTIAVVVVALIGLGMYFLWAPKAEEVGYRPVDVGGGSITVEDQQDVAQVTLAAELAAPGWITIHESMSGAPADIIGTSAYLEAGTHEEIVIPVSPDMLPGYRYITLLHVDDGDQVFEVQEDLPVKTNEQVVRPDFVAVPEETTVPEPTAEEGENAEETDEESSEGQE